MEISGSMTDILLLGILCGVTIVAYLVAINAHGVTRLSISYLFATILLVGTVWAIVQYSDLGRNQEKMAQLRKLEEEKRAAEERILSQQDAITSERERRGFLAKITKIHTAGSTLSTFLINVNLTDSRHDFATLVGRAEKMKSDVEALKKEFDSLVAPDGISPEVVEATARAITLLTDAANYYRLFYSSEDGAQEELRRRVMRRNAEKSLEEFNASIESAQMAVN